MVPQRTLLIPVRVLLTVPRSRLSDTGAAFYSWVPRATFPIPVALGIQLFPPTREKLGRSGFEPEKGVSPPRLQRGPFGRLGTCP